MHNVWQGKFPRNSEKAAVQRINAVQHDTRGKALSRQSAVYTLGRTEPRACIGSHPCHNVDRPVMQPARVTKRTRTGFVLVFRQQYCAQPYQKLLRQHGSMVLIGGKGNFYGNSTVKSVFASLRAEPVWRRNRQTRRKVEVALLEYIYGDKNPRRRPSALGCKSPLSATARVRASREFCARPLRMRPGSGL